MLYHGDNLDIIPTLPRGSVQTIVTSPPYYGLRDYGLPPSQYPAIEYAPMAGLPPVVVEAQAVCLGLEQSLFAYVAHLVHTFRLLRDALKDDGTCWLNLGDCYSASTMKPHTGQRKDRDQGGMSGLRRMPPQGLKVKDLVGIPWRVAFALQADGWYLRSDICWHKTNAMPESVTDRPTKAHEYVFLLAKSERYFYDAEAIAEPLATPSVFAGNRARQVAATGNIISGGTSEHKNVLTTRNARSVWSVPTKALAAAHYAPMPEALAERCIRAGSRPGDTVLDPYAGTGTTLRVAERLQRVGWGIDLNADYIKIAEGRTDGVQLEIV